jgi:hypothetical protein
MRKALRYAAISDLGECATGVTRDRPISAAVGGRSAATIPSGPAGQWRTDDTDHFWDAIAEA